MQVRTGEVSVDLLMFNQAVILGGKIDVENRLTASVHEQ